MKLAEGLSLRKDLQTRVAQLKERLMKNVKVYDGDEPMENPEEPMKEFDRCLNHLEKHIFRISKTIMQAVEPNGKSQTQMMAERNVLKIQIGILGDVFNYASSKVEYYSRTEIKHVSVIVKLCSVLLFCLVSLPVNSQQVRRMPVAKSRINQQQINNLNQKVHKQELELKTKQKVQRNINVSPSKDIIKKIKQEHKKVKQIWEEYEVPIVPPMEDIQNRKQLYDSAFICLHMADTLNYIKYIKRSVSAQYPLAIYAYGLSILDGVGVRSNEDIGLYYINRASESNCPEAICFIAELYESGDYGYKKDSIMALRLYEESARQGSFRGKAVSGEIHFDRGDTIKAINYWKSAYEQGVEKALIKQDKNILAQIAYYLGFLSSLDPQKEIETRNYMRTSAELGHVGAMCALPTIYYDSHDNDSTILWGIKPECRDSADIQYIVGAAYYVKGDFDNAETWWKKAAAQKQPDALWWMYCLCEVHNKDSLLAFDYLKQAVDAKYPDALNDMACCYANGDMVEKDMEKAKELFLEAAYLGFGEAYNNLANLYTYKDYIKKPNWEKAAKYYQKGAEMNDPAAQYNYGMCLKKGKGVKKDKQAAIHWLTLAGQNGYNEAEKQIK